MAATERQWYVGEDGCIPIGEPASDVTYHSALNSIIVSTKEPSVKIYDVASGAILQKSSLSAQGKDAVKCMYISGKDRILFCDQNGVGVRSDLRGMILLDTALQPPVFKTEDLVRVEIPLVEAIQLLKSLVSAELPGVDHVDDTVKELEKRIEFVQESTKGNLKTSKWATVCVELPHAVLKSVCSSLVSEMRRLMVYNPGLSVASAISDRLTYLLPNPQLLEGSSAPCERAMMYSEAARQETFKKWPHMNYKWALPDPMSQAGFYHQPNSIGDDRAMCFTCNVCLVCWEPTDEPWSEHERHSPACPFVKGEYTQNVPLSVTYASQPARRHGDRNEKVECLSTTNTDDFVATSTLNGNIVVWNISKISKKHCQFNLDPTATVIAMKTGLQIDRPSVREIHTQTTEVESSEGAEQCVSVTNGEGGCDVKPEFLSTNCIDIIDGQVKEQESLYEIPLYSKPDKSEASTRSRPCEDVQVKSLCVLRKPNPEKWSSSKENCSGSSGTKSKRKSRSYPQPTVVCGASLRRTNLTLSNKEVQNTDITTEVQLMNEVNEVVSCDSNPRIIEDEDLEDEDEGCQDELLNSTEFVPHILLLAVKDDSRKSSKHKEKESKKVSSSLSTSELSYVNVPVLGSGDHVTVSSSNWAQLDPMFDPDPDPDVQITGITPGPSTNFTGTINVSTSDSSPIIVKEHNGPTEPEQGKSDNTRKTEEVTVKNTSVTLKLRAGAVLQCVELPENLRSDNFEISHIIPTLDGQHLIVVVKPSTRHWNVAASAENNAVISNSITNNCDEPQTASEDLSSPSSVSDMDIDLPKDNEGDGDCQGGCILVYSFTYGNEYAVLDESPVIVKCIDRLDQGVKHVLVLPHDVCDLQEDDDDCAMYGQVGQVPNSVSNRSSVDIHGQIAVTLVSGKVWLLNLCDLSRVAEVTPPSGDTFVSSTYCTGIERLCICTAHGKLHFYQLCDHSPPQTKQQPLDSPDGLCNGEFPAEHDTIQSKPEQESRETTDKYSPGSDMLTKQPISVENLVILHNLIQFENLMPRFTATVPACWTEIQQEQQQRRHPQHLQHQGEATQHTRTWKLQQDCNTWEEHMLEIVLPRPCCVGHVDVKFTLQPQCSNPPDIQVTLLKQNITSLGRQPTMPSSPSNADVDTGIDFGMSKAGSSSESQEFFCKPTESSSNNVLDPMFQESHNAEILCGPINLSTCLDLSGSSGIITLTSPQLMSSKPKAFLLHFRGFAQNKNTDDKTNDKPKDSKKKAAPATNTAQKMKVMKTAFDNDLFVPLKETVISALPRPKLPENLQGCDWIQELSITIRKSKKLALPKERLQRISMIESTQFHGNLLSAVSLEDEFVFGGISSQQWQDMILDILMWITAIQNKDPEKKSSLKSLPETIQSKLGPLIKACFISGSRTTAHKCARLLAMCMDHNKHSSDADITPTFSWSLLQALLECLKLLPSAHSAGAVKWFFSMLNRVKCVDATSVAQSCAELMMFTAKHYYDRLLPLHSLLKSRFGLYGQPFDPDLFDTDLPMALKQTIPVTPNYAAAVGCVSTAGNNNNNSVIPTLVADEMDFYDLFNPPSEKSSKAQLEYARSSIFGLLEVEPLHFICHSTSDGTKMERLDTSATGHSASLNTSGLSGTINFGEALPSQPPTASASTLATMSSNMTKQLIQENSQKSYTFKNKTTFKHKIDHIKDAIKILSEVNKTISDDLTTKTVTSDQLLPPTPKTTPQVMTPPMTPPNETWQQNQGTNDKSDALKQQYAQAQKSSLGIPNTQTLLQPPPLQVLVIERMHSGARRFVILDFGKPVVLTDVVIPACADLASLSIDVWVQGEEIDGQRFVVAGDIGSRSLIMNDIMPAPVCRYLKITTIGRYGSGSTRTKIPIGAFYGHSCILPWEWNSYLEQQNSQGSSMSGSQIELPTQPHLLAQLSVYMSLLEDIQCRYSLARTRLENLLAAVNTQQYASGHIQYYLKKQKKNDCDNKILQAYHDCLQLQLQLNLAQRATDRLHSALGFKGHRVETSLTLNTRLRQACTDKLRFLLELTLDTLLSLTTVSPSIPQPPASLFKMLDPLNSEMLFKHLCVHGTKKIQIGMGMLLMRVCGSQQWWGNFLGNALQEFFHSENTQIFSQDRVFVLLLAMGQKALSGPSAVHIMESLLDMLARVLTPLINNQQTMQFGQSGLIDLTLVGWILLFLCRNLDHTFVVGSNGEDRQMKRENGNSLPNRWNFIQGDHNLVNNKSKVKSSKLYRWSMHKRLLHHKQKLMDLQQAQKTFFSSDKTASGSSTSLLKQQEKQFRKELSQYASKMRSNVDALRKLPKMDEIAGPSKSSGDYDQDGVLVLSKDKTLRVVRGLMALLLSMDFTCNVDLFLVTCKVLATICVTTRPAITLSEAMGQEQLEKLILLASNMEFSHSNISWGGPWAGHAITCLLQDILDGEKFYPPNNDTTELTEECISNITETDESLPSSVGLPTMEDSESGADNQDADSSESKDDSTKMNFDKESSMMVDLLLNGEEEYEESAAKLHAYVTGHASKPPPPPMSPYETPLPTTSLNGALEMNSSGVFSAEMEKVEKLMVQKLIGQNKQMAEMTKGDKTLANTGTTLQQMPSLLGCTLSGYPGTMKSSLMATVQGMSTAMDARLEFGLETHAEIRLKTMLSLHTENVQQAFSSSLPVAPSPGISVEQSSPPTTDDDISESRANLPENSSSEMLSQCYAHLFNNLIPQHTNLDALLQLWLTLNGEGSSEGSSTQLTFDPSRTPLIPLSTTSMANMLALVNATPSLPVCTWVLVFQSLTLLANQKIRSHPLGPEQSMVIPMMAERNLMAVITRFLSGTSEYGPIASAAQFSQVGPSATKSFYEFLLRLLVKCSADNLKNLKELMLKLVYTLCAERGAFHSGLGPLDAQCKFLSFILDMSYENIEVGNAMGVIESISSLVHQHILCQERISCRSSSENNVNARSCFGGLFASLLRGVDSRSSPGDASRDSLMCSLLRLINSLIQIRYGPRTSRMSSVVLDNSTEPHTPTLNLSALATSTPTSAFMLSDEEKCQQTDEQKTENLHAPPEPNNTYVADIILGHRQIMCHLMEALSYCNSNTMAMILASRGVSSHMQDTFTGSNPISVGDGIYQILRTLSSHCSDQKLVLESLFYYMSGSYMGMASSPSLCRLSEPLLWFMLKVLDNSRAIHIFLDMGGVEVVCRNLVSCNCRIINTSPSLISTIMQNLNGRSKMMEKKTTGEPESPDGLQNFAPLGSISSSSPTASPADVLIQAAQTHRRARSAAWSYHFYPDEAWVDLTVQLPFAILLKEVQIQPHNASLTTCPAFVSLEISHDGVTSTPLCQPLMTSSLAFIKLQLQRPEVATCVTIRLHKARDSMTIGLSQIQLVGYSAFGDTGNAPQNIFMPTEDFVSRSSVRWIRLLHHCMTAHKEVESQVAAAAACTPNLLNTCSALLVSPMSNVYAPNIENVLLNLGLHSISMGLALIDNILRSPLGQADANSGITTPYLGKVSGLANDSTVELLYQLSTVQDSGTKHRVKALLDWLRDSARLSLQRTSMYSAEGYIRGSPLCLPSPAPSHIQCVASVLWYSHEAQVEYNLSDLITVDLVSALYEWSTVLKSDSALKKSVNYVLCSVCHINPEYFSQLLTWMGVIVNDEVSMTSSVCDDRKDGGSHLHQECLTDDSKEANSIQRQQSLGTDSPVVEDIPVPGFRHIVLEEAHLSTLSLACKSPVAIKQLLDSGFPAVLAQGLFEFCSKVMSHLTDGFVNLEGLTDTSKTMNDDASTSKVNGDNGNDTDNNLWITADIVAAVLQFFSEVSSEPLMKDWLGGAEGNIFWPAILTMLCNTPVQATAIRKNSNQRIELMSLEDRTAIETAAVRFFTQVTSCHIVNQLLFAKVLCEVVKEQNSTSKTGQVCSNFPLSGFTRCLFLQALLEDEKVLVALQFSPQQQQDQRIQLSTKNINPVEHPKYSGGRNYHTMMVSLHTTCADLLQKVSDSPGLAGQFLEKAAEKSDESKRELSGTCSTEIAEYISTVAKGQAAKDKRTKDDRPESSKSMLPPRPPTRRGRHTADAVTSQLFYPTMSLYHQKLPNKALPGELTLSQLLQILHQRGEQEGHSVLQFYVKIESKKKETTVQDARCSPTDDWTESDEDILSDATLLSVSSFPTALQVFASVGGLALLAEHLPLLYPEIARHPTQDFITNSYSSKTMSNSTELHDWVTVEPFPEDFYELYEPVSPAPAVSRATNPSVAMPSIPPHSLVAFGLFLRLPGYAEVLLKERKKAQCLLRLVLGVTDDGDGGHILTSSIASSLPTLPFLVLKTLYDSTPLTTDDGVLLRRMSLDIWVIHLILACLSVLSHHIPRTSVPGFQQEAQMILSAMQTATTPTVNSVSHSSEEKSQQYWAKGTGFGTGSTTSSWDAEQALVRQKSEEEHVACLLQVLASYVNPSGEVPKCFEDLDYTAPSEKMLLPPNIPELLSQSCLVPAISSYLRNDSVLDMARHIPLYRSLLELLRGIAVCPTLVPLLLPLDKENNTDSTAAVGILLDKMRVCVDTYASRLKSNKGKNGQAGDEEENEGLALLIPNIQETAHIVKVATERLQKSTVCDNSSIDNEETALDSLSYKETQDRKYIEAMKVLQFDTSDLVIDDGNGIKFTSPHHYENNVKAAGEINNPARTRRLAQEAVTLSTSLPLSAGSCVFVRCDEERLDIMKVMITGPADTPYENGCFEFDVYFPQDYPNSPPFINLETTGNHTIRFNPNLYNDGKVCLSVLNTWHGRPEEKWNSNTSSFLQVLVSIQSLILVSEPYFNEPGYERSRGTTSGTASSREYDANIRQATVKWAMLEQVRNPTPCFKEVVHRHNWLKRHHILRQCEHWIAEMESYCNDKRTGRTIAHSTLALKRHYNQLREEYAKMKPPEGLEEEEEGDIDPKGKQYQTDNSLNTSASIGDLEAAVAGPSTSQTDPCNNI
ncbi:baculoviral IAP repeat-containing protein 6-like isoform X2 [Mizuhopecten yessoensis]|uniref:Dual E2 ubiquitin-conjugating enzyme/E3 ubiquitin-protein ligase BIRC6 n=1 Tax=Mizuhopecten yessoensis TaxID=6573 RepID=A0A210QAD8_MIZYE|nr:baculoviral IAP repeat-containing protein 6-like isoform X2 [Mizuhopecten yessoensis]OWF45700.1 Baculoviral IAP repeat-containing protein 6 [Mizuhopecten yessoensis]